ncbi:hypothetical protein J3R82DRAFT_10825 [Butyriboletus roseoflavus]|nr:hypothetical protein J3R82DRAFT_10825 [Butyriboletus roseoflavus]
MTELKEFEASKSKCQLGRLASETIPDCLPTEPQEGINEEEIAVIRSHNDILRAIKHLRRMHSDKVQKLEESSRTLRKLEKERQQREAEEAERHRIAEEERLQAHAEAERARQVLEEKQRQFEAERKRQQVETDREQAQLLAEQQAHAEATDGQTFGYRSHPKEVSVSQQQGIADMRRIRATPVANSLSSEFTTAMNADEDGKAFAPHRAIPLSDIHTSSGGSQSTTSQSKQQKDRSVSGGVMLALSTPKTSPGHLPPKLLAKLPSPSTLDHVAENAVNPARTFPAIPVSLEGGHRSSLPIQLASEFNRVVNPDIPLTPDQKSTFPRTPKPQTLLDATIGGSEEFNIGPVTGVSPAQQNVNLRHLKRYRSRIEENDSGDRSVRTSVKSEENSVSMKKEEHDEPVLASLLTNLPASLPPRPAIIPPPRPRKRRAAPASQTNSTSSYPPESNQLSSTKGGAGVTTDEQPREALSRGSPSSHAMHASVQLLVPAETRDSLLLGPVYPELQPTESHINAGERSTQDRAEIYDATSSEPASATLPHELDGDDPSRSNRRFTDEFCRARSGNNPRRQSDHYPPPFIASRSTVTSPTQPYRRIDSWRPQNVSNGPRAEAMRVTSPTTGRKRNFEFDDDDIGHRARRHRGDVWIAQDLDRERVDSHHPYWDRRLDSEPDERRAAYRAPTSPPDRIRSYPSDIPRATYDNRTHISPLSEEPTALIARWEQSLQKTRDRRHVPTASATRAWLQRNGRSASHRRHQGRSDLRAKDGRKDGCSIRSFSVGADEYHSTFSVINQSSWTR